MVWVLAALSVVLLVTVMVVTNPVRARPFESRIAADPSRLLADVEALTGLPGFRCYERMAHVVTGVYAALTTL